MTIGVLTASIGACAFGAGLLGSLTGLGGGIVIVPLLTLMFGVDIHYAMGASLVSVIGTSSGSAVAFLRQGYANMRIGMLLELATTGGALLGAFAAGWLSARTIATVFSVVLFLTALQSLRARADLVTVSNDRLARRLRLGGAYPLNGTWQRYEVEHVPLGFGLMFGAGVLSALLGIGSGVVKVLAMDRVMHLPFKVSTTTSNLMIGVTAAASAGIYLHRGYIDPTLAFPVVIGVLGGAIVGARVLHVADTKWLRWLFTATMFVLAAEMLRHGLMGGDQ